MQSQPTAHSNPVRIVIADAQSSFRGILRKQLEQEPRVQVVGEAHDSRAAGALTRRLQPDIILIDRALSRGFSLKKSASGHTTVIVVLVATNEIRNIVEAFELGAKGVVLKTSLPREWKAPIQSVLTGQYWVGHESVTALVLAARELLVRSEIKTLPGFGLTLREVEIAGKIVAGRSNKEVGRDFSICERTVKHHLTNIFKKVGVSSRLELAVLVRDKIAPWSEVSEKYQSQRGSDNSDQTPEKPQLYLVAEP